jgi:hypothetical protein
VVLEGADRQMLRDHFIARYGSDQEEWSSIIYVRIEPQWMTAFAMTDEEMARIEADKAARGER